MSDYVDAYCRDMCNGEDGDVNQGEEGLISLLGKIIIMMMLVLIVFCISVFARHRSQDIEHGADFPVECGLFTPSMGLPGIRFNHYYH